MDLINSIERLYTDGMDIDPFSLDFAALRTLRLVHAFGSFSLAAETLGVTQPSVSYTMTRLREVFGDPLFVRHGNGIAPTARCDDIVLQVAGLLDSFEALTAPINFNPARTTTEITVSCNYYERVTLIPELARIVRRDGPGIRLNIISSFVRGKEQLMRAESDILIGPIRIEAAGYFRRALLNDPYVCVADPANQLTKRAITVSEYCAAPQVLVHYGGSYRPNFLLELDRRGLAPNGVMQVPSPANLPDFLIGTDMIATVPKRIAQTYGDAVAWFEFPFPAEFQIDLYWTARTHMSAPHVWLRRQLAEAAKVLRTPARVFLPSRQGDL